MNTDLQNDVNRCSDNPVTLNAKKTNCVILGVLPTVSLFLKGTRYNAIQGYGQPRSFVLPVGEN